MDTKFLIDSISEKVKGLLKDHQAEISQAYLKCDEGEALTISISNKLKGSDKTAGILVETSISFVTEKVKDSVKYVVNENQPEIKFPEKKDAKRKG